MKLSEMKINKNPCNACPYIGLDGVPYENLDPGAQDMYHLTLRELIEDWQCGQCHKSNGNNVCYGHWMDRKRVENAG